MKAHQLTMLNPRSSSLEKTGGGAPKITPEDIAGELAQLQDQPIKIYALCLLHAPGMAPMYRKPAFQEFIAIAMVEWRKRIDRVNDLIVELGVNQAAANKTRIIYLNEELEKAERELWPSPLPRNNQKANYYDVFKAASIEFQQLDTCTKCNRNVVGVVAKPSNIAKCKSCRGTGKMQLSDNARAKACNMHHEVFSRGWVSVFKRCMTLFEAS